MLRFGPDSGPVVVVALPLFEEANRTRWLSGAILRALAAEGIGGVLPDLPGQGESLQPLDGQTILSMRTAYEGLVEGLGAPCYGVGIRSGALLDALGSLLGRWHFAPQDGPALLRELTRLRAGGDNRPDTGEPVSIAGNLVSADLLAELAGTVTDRPGPLRTIRLTSDAGAADRKVDGAPPWRRAEPGSDPVLAQILATDIAQWVRACDGC